MIPARVGRLTETEKVGLGLDLARLEGGGACPTQFEGETRDGREVYIRYRGGRLSIDVDGEELIARDYGPWLHGSITLGQACDLLGLTIMGERPPPDPTSPWHEWLLPLGAGVGYYVVGLRLTARVVTSLLTALAERWPEAILAVTDTDYDGQVRRTTRHVPLAEAETLLGRPIRGGDARATLWQDAATRDAEMPRVFEAGMRGHLAATLSFDGWRAPDSRIGRVDRLLRRSGEGQDCPLHLPEERADNFALEMAVARDDARSRANLEAVDATLAEHLVPATWETVTERDGARAVPDRQPWSGRDMVDWCARSPRHAVWAWRPSPRDPDKGWTWERVTT